MKTSSIELRGFLLFICIATLPSCLTEKEVLLLNMSEEELSDYNATLPEHRRIECQIWHRPGTLNMTRKVCAPKTRMARLQSPGSQTGEQSFTNSSFPIFGNNRRASDERGIAPRAILSPPPPGYDKPVIRFLGSDGRIR